MQLKKEGKSYHEIIIMKTSPGYTDKVQNSLRKWENENIYLYLLYLHKEALLNTQETNKGGSLQRAEMRARIGCWSMTFKHISFYELLIYK